MESLTQLTHLGVFLAGFCFAWVFFTWQIKTARQCFDDIQQVLMVRDQENDSLRNTLRQYTSARPQTPTSVVNRSRIMNDELEAELES